MTEENKYVLKTFGKVIILSILALSTIVTSAGVWNVIVAGETLEKIIGVAAGISLISGGIGVALLAKKLFKTNKKLLLD